MFAGWLGISRYSTVWYVWIAAGTIRADSYDGTEPGDVGGDVYDKDAYDDDGMCEGKAWKDDDWSGKDGDVNEINEEYLLEDESFDDGVEDDLESTFCVAEIVDVVSDVFVDFFWTFFSA